MFVKQLIRQFFEKHGCTIQQIDGTAVRGILTRIDSAGITDGQIAYDRLGFTVKREFLLLAPADSGVLTSGATVQAGGRRLRVIETDQTVYADEILCDRAYAYELKEGL